MTTEGLSALLGQRLWIRWRDTSHDWPWFRVVAIVETGPLLPPMLQLQGEDAPAATATWGRYTGGPITVPSDDIVETLPREQGPEVWW